MPRNQFQRMVFAFLTVVITVHAYVFYSLYVVNGNALMQANGTNHVLDAINKQGGVMMFGDMVPIWKVVLIEFCFAYIIEVTLGSPCSFKIACRAFDPRKNHPIIFETMIICATVLIMCPIMSLIAAFMYYPYYEGFNIFTALANWIKLVCFNFPFAFFSQIFFIQPFIRRVFKIIFSKDIKERERLAYESESKGEKLKPINEAEAIADIWKHMDEIRDEMKLEIAKAKAESSNNKAKSRKKNRKKR